MKTYKTRNAASESEKMSSPGLDPGKQDVGEKKRKISVASNIMDDNAKGRCQSQR